MRIAMRIKKMKINYILFLNSILFTLTLFISPALSEVLNDNNGSGTIEIDAYGDSITRGVGDFNSPGESISGALESQLGGQEAGYPLRIETLLGIPVSNQGVSGERISISGAGRISQAIIARRPDVATISGGSNDTFSQINSNDIFHAYQTIINVAKAVGTDPVLITIPPICCDRIASNGFVNIYNNSIRELAIINDLTLADVNKAFTNTCSLDNCQLLNVPEGLHPNISGYDVMGEAIIASLLDIDLFDGGGPSRLEGALDLPEGSVTTVPDP